MKKNRTILSLLFLSALGLPVACGAGDDGPGKTSGGGGQGGAAPAASVEDNQPIAMGGALPEGTHPLFGAGSYTGVDMSDPCNSSQVWKVGVNLELGTGTQVVYQGKLWRIDGVVNAADVGAGTSEVQTVWTMDICTPPGADWCASQFKWADTGTACPVQ